MKKIYAFMALLCLILTQGKAQNIFPATGSAGIGTNAPVASSLLEMRSTTKGFLAPRMTAAQRAAIASPATGLLVYQTDGTAGYYYYYGTGWRLLLYSAATTTLNNLSTTTSVNRSLLPQTSASVDLGSFSKLWRKGFFSDTLQAGTITSGSTNSYYGVNATGSGSGVYAYSPSGYGVYGSSGYLGVFGTGASYGVYGSSSTYGVYGFSGSSYGVYGYGNWGVYGYSGSSYGVYGVCSNFDGVYGEGHNGVFGSSATGNGSWGTSVSGYAVVGDATGSGYAGWFQSATGWGVVGKTGNTAGQWAGVFYGNTYASGSYQTSDRRLKKNIAEFSDALSIIGSLKPRTYEFQTEGKMAEMNLPRGKHYGLIAQDVEAVLPELVKEIAANPAGPDSKPIANKTTKAPVITGNPSEKIPQPQVEETAAAKTEEKKKDELTIKVVNYTELIPVLIKGMQELNEKNTALQNEVNELKALLKQNSNSNIINAQAGYIKQNVPNPAKNATVISYYVPENVSRAQITVTDSKGSLLKTFSASKGIGQISIGLGELPAGTYNYSLHINDQRVDTKQMVITK